MKKHLVVLCLVLVALFTSCGKNTKEPDTPTIIEDGGEISILLQKGEKFVGFSVGNNDHTLWISSSDNNGEIHIRCYYSTVTPINKKTHLKITNNN